MDKDHLVELISSSLICEIKNSETDRNGIAPEDEIVKVNLKSHFLNEDEHPRKNIKIDDLKLLKTVPGIKSVKFLAVGGKPVTVDGNPLVV